MLIANPSATYRGYRRQALYVLSRVILDKEASERVYQPEGCEDLYVRSLNGDLVEVVQVKDYGTPLTFSDFEPNEPKCFFYRVHERLINTPGAANKLVAYGPLGPELDGLIGKVDVPDRKAQKLTEYASSAKARADRNNRPFRALSVVDARKVLSSVSFERIEESKLVANLHAALKESIMGASSETALDLLMWWIFQASENLESLTRADVLRKAHQIGQALAAMESHHQEWGRSIVVLDTKTISANERSILRTGFDQGVQATWRHILAGVDVRRDIKMGELRDKFGRNNVAILHGASGQGKSTLAYRYLLECCPDGWRFQVAAVAGRTHALNVAQALNSHAEAMGVPAHILLDVGPNDEAWTELVVRLASNPSIKVLVVVREEDYRRAHFDPSSVLPEQVNLDALTEPDAHAIFVSLTARQPTKHFLNFNDAWSQFGGTGPLMEFTYLINQGQSLRDKLTSQIERLEAEASRAQSEISPKHLSLLTLVSVGAAFECRLKTASACLEVGLSTIPNPLRRFEEEYLVRQFDEYGFVGGLHAIRSTFVRDRLLRVSPELWADHAVKCLRLLVPRDMEGFLLRAFSRKPEHADKIVQGLVNLRELTWEVVGGITRALLWLGMSRYEETNRETLQALQTISGDGWMFFLDGFLAERGDATFRSIQEVAAQKSPVAKLLAERVKQTPKEAAFAQFKSWIEQVGVIPKPPSSRAEWSGLAEVAFWLGHLKLDGAVRQALETIPYNSALVSLNIKELADVVFGVSQTASAAFQSWRTVHEATLRERFLRETESLEVEVSSQRAFVRFLVEDEIDQSTASVPGEIGGWHEQTMRRLNTLHALFPHAELYASQGVGFDVLPFKVAHDPTRKEMPAKNFFAPNAVRFNATFNGLVKLRHARPVDWKDYLHALLESRKNAAEVLKRLQRGLDKIFEKRGTADLWQRFITEEEWNKASSQLTLQHLPKCAVDEWGFASDGRANGTSIAGSQGAPHAAAFTAYLPFLKSARDFIFSLGLFFTQFKEASALCLVLRSTDDNEARRPEFAKQHPDLQEFENKRRLCLLNLSSALEELPSFQIRFRELFGFRIDAEVLDELELSEKRTLEKLFGTCRQFILHPTRVLSGATSFAENVERNNRRLFLTKLKSELAKLKESAITATIVADKGSWEGRGALWLSASAENLRKMRELSGAIAMALLEAIKTCNFGEWETSPLQREWSRIVIVPQLRSRSLNRCGHSMPSLTLFSPPASNVISPIYSVALPAAFGDWPDALEVWTDPAATLCVRWLDSAMTYLIRFERLKHLFLAAEKAGALASALEPLLEKLSRTTSSAINPAAEAYEHFHDHVRARVNGDPACRIQCESVLTRLEEWGNNVFPHMTSGQKTVQLGPKEYLEWWQATISSTPATMEIATEILEHLLPKG